MEAPIFERLLAAHGSWVAVARALGLTSRAIWVWRKKMQQGETLRPRQIMALKALEKREPPA